MARGTSQRRALHFSEATALHAAVENVGGQATALMQLALVEGLDSAYERATCGWRKALDLLADQSPNCRSGLGVQK